MSCGVGINFIIKFSHFFKFKEENIMRTRVIQQVMRTYLHFLLSLDFLKNFCMCNMIDHLLCG